MLPVSEAVQSTRQKPNPKRITNSPNSLQPSKIRQSNIDPHLPQIPNKISPPTRKSPLFLPSYVSSFLETQKPNLHPIQVKWLTNRVKPTSLKNILDLLKVFNISRITIIMKNTAQKIKTVQCSIEEVLILVEAVGELFDA